MNENYVEQTENEVLEQNETTVVAEEQPQDAIPQKIAKRIPSIPKKVWIPVLAIIVVLAIAIPVVCSLLFNNYKTPLKLTASLANARTYDAFINTVIKQSNGLWDKEVEALFDILMDSEELDLDDAKDDYADNIDEVKDLYGDNYKFYFVIEEKVELDKDELRDIKDELKEYGKNAKEAMEEYDDYDSDDWKDEAEDMGISKSQLKKLVKTVESLSEKLRSVKITKGYELTVIKMVKGSELDEPEELSETTITVCKINGKWVCPETVVSSIYSYF